MITGSLLLVDCSWLAYHIYLSTSNMLIPSNIATCNYLKDMFLTLRPKIIYCVYAALEKCKSINTKK